MESFTQNHPWKIIQNALEDKAHFISESLMSLGNGRMGQRANFPETYSGPSLQGNYIAGVYYPDKTRVGWWKNGYPEYFAKVPNSVNWIGIHLIINEVKIDLHKTEVVSYHRELDMQEGVLRRSIQIKPSPGLLIEIISERFYSIVHQNLGFLKYKVQVIEGNCSITIAPYLDFNIRNSDANYDEDFWQDRTEESNHHSVCVSAITRKTNYHVAAAMACAVNAPNIVLSNNKKTNEGYVEERYSANLAESEFIELIKYVAITSSMYYEAEQCGSTALQLVQESKSKGYNEQIRRQKAAWLARWAQNDIIINGDISAQQGIRFNIFQLYQTYSGEDPRLNIGPKGFTGEKYGGSTYWDTEAYCLPFYMGTSNQEVARNLLIYRYKHLSKAIENAEKLGFSDGAALYPMVTMTGEECHNEWEITFEEIHRNGAIA
ncbi:MAG: maltose phosphorylase, partial [Saprospiraceae bacterium]